jgi:hypothetical protein
MSSIQDANLAALASLATFAALQYQFLSLFAYFK